MAEKEAAKKLVDKIKNFYETTGADTMIKFEDVTREVAEWVFFYLDEDGLERGKISYREEAKIFTIVMPGFLHESVAGAIGKLLTEWALVLPPTWQDDIFIATTPRSSGFLGRRRRTKKEPDYAIYPIHQHQPSVVLEVADTESYTDALYDKDTWLHHTGGAVRVVILVKWYRRTGGVTGFLELWRPGGSQRYEIFPLPAQNIPNPYITIGELYGGTPPTASNSQTALPINLDTIRGNARQSLTLMGLREAI